MKDSVGKSAITPFKQEDLLSLLTQQIGNAYGVYRKYSTEAYYNNCEQNYFIDCSAGNMNEYEKTSPGIFLKELYKYQYFPSKLLLIEKNKITYKKLKENFDKLNLSRPYPNVFIFKKDMKNVLCELNPHKYRYGLIYFDPNGFRIDDYEAISKFLIGNPRMDLIININVTQIKRNRPVHKINGFDKYNNLYLSNIQELFHKNNVWVRDDVMLRKVRSMFKYVMMFGTNNPNFNLRCHNFVRLESEEGQRVINKYNFTTNELKNGHYQNQIGEAIQLPIFH
jgi:hypothetical protein